MIEFLANEAATDDRRDEYPLLRILRAPDGAILAVPVEPGAAPAPAREPFDPAALPPVGSRWLHSNGNRYTVRYVANLAHAHYPLMVVYQGEDGRIWAKAPDGFLRSRTRLGRPCRACKAETIEVVSARRLTVKEVDLDVTGLRHLECPACGAQSEAAEQIDWNRARVQAAFAAFAGGK